MDSFGYMVTSKKVCSPLTKRSAESGTVKFSEIENGIQLEFENSDTPCADTTKVGNYGLNIKAYCDSSMTSG